MATCTFNPGIDSSNPYAVLTVTEKSYDVNKNTSVVAWDLKLYRPYSISSSTSKGYSIVVNGATVASGSTTIGGSGTKTIASGTTTIAHNSDGKKTISFSFSLDFKITWSGTYIGTGSASGSLALTNIPRVSTFSVSKTSADMGTAVTFTINRASNAFTHKLTLTWGGAVSNIATNVATSQSWTIPLSLANDLPNSTSSGCIITCITYNGSTEIGRKTLAMTLKVPTSVKPSISAVTISEAASGIASKFGAYIQGASKLKVVTTAAGSYSSTIKSYSVKILNKTYSGATITSDVINSSGSVAVAVTVTDTRGRTATSTKNVTVTAYNHPSITKFIAERCDSDGTVNDSGEYVKVTFAFTVASLNSKNDKSYTIAYKLKSASSYTNLTSGSSYSLNTTYVSSIVFNVDSSFDFMITVSDYFGSVSYIADVPTAFTLLDYHSSGKGVAFGKVAESADTFEVALNAVFNKTLRAKKGIYIEDTRDVDLTPDEYRALGRGVYYEFKRCTTVSLSDTSNTYCTVETFVQWGNTSGGSIKQILYDNDRVWYRYGESTAWGAWKPILYRMAWQAVENGISYKIHNGMCTVRGNSNTTLSISPSGVVACTLPAVARPTIEIFGSLTTKANACGQVSINTDGKVTLWNLSAASTYWAFTITYPID